MTRRGISIGVLLGASLEWATSGCAALVEINGEDKPLGDVGTVQPSPVGEVGEPCAPAGALGCSVDMTKSPLICGADGTWQANGLCDEATSCDSTAGPEQGTCKPILAGCEGSPPDTVVCDGATRVICGPDLVGGVEVETCPFVCVGGACVGECVPQAKTCDGAAPQVCGSDGAWEDAAPCEPATEVCAGGGCVPRSSCAEGLSTCGPAGTEDCCDAPVVPGGTYDRSNDNKYPATVSDFRMDRFEVTVGRFRAFMRGYPWTKPSPGAGAHPLIEGSGWDPAWDAELPADTGAMMSALHCSSLFQTWTDEAGGNEDLPMNCLSWYDAFAFCAWDGGRLPTEAEWNYAAAGGSEQREYPWGAAKPDASTAVFNCGGDGSAASCTLDDILKVGSRSPKGDAKWGQADMAGEVAEWALDLYTFQYPKLCADCANVSLGSNRVARGGTWEAEAAGLSTASRGFSVTSLRHYNIGVRCVRAL